MSLRFLWFFTFLFIIQIGYSQFNFNNALEKFLNKEEYKSASVGIHIVNTETGDSVFGFNSEKLLIPASTLKLVTSATALELLGTDYRFETKIGYTGRIEDGILKGDLVIIGGGDPALGSAYFREHYFNPDFLDVWSEKIRDAGIKEVRGELIMDISLYDSEKIPPTWIWEDIGNYYGAGTNALTVYDNHFRITFHSPRKAGKQTEITGIYPKIEGLEIKNEVLSSDTNGDLAFVFGSPFDKKRVISGTIPKNRKSFAIKAAVPQPEILLANDLIEHLSKNGIFITGEIRVENSSSTGFKLLYVQESPPLFEIVNVLNHESVNLFAEHLLKQIAAEKNGKGMRKDGIEIIKEFWKKRGIETDFLFMEDGSGLSHFNAVSSHFFTNLLVFMTTKSSNKSAFLNSLPTPGNGTLIYFDKGKFSPKVLMLKSGSMKRVRCYAGYLSTDSGKNFAISIMVNHFGGSHSELIHEVENLLYQLKISY